MRLIILRSGIDTFTLKMFVNDKASITYPGIKWPVNGIGRIEFGDFHVDTVSVTQSPNWWWRLLTKINDWLVPIKRLPDLEWDDPYMFNADTQITEPEHGKIVGDPPGIGLEEYGVRTVIDKRSDR